MGPFDEILLLSLLAIVSIEIGGFLLRAAPIRNVRSRGAGMQLSASDHRTRRAFEVLASATLAQGNRVEVLKNGDELFPRLFADLRAAEQLITWQVFWFKPGQVADELARVLLDRAAAGVEVLVLLDHYGKRGLPDEYVAALRRGGVDVQIYRPPAFKGLYKYPHRSHVRSVVIDSRVGYTGGLGIDDHWLGNGRAPEQWRDTHVRIEGPVIDQLQGPFLANWAECTGELLVGQALMEADRVAAKDSQHVAVMYGSPSLGSTTAERFFALSLAVARDTLFITSAYFVPNRGIRTLLCRAAATGADVRVLTAGAKTDRPSARYAGRAVYEELLRAGVRIYEYAPTMIHAKTLVVDKLWLSVGSINLDNRSLKLNDEVALVAQDETLGRELHETFLADLQFADEVLLEEFRRRPRAERVYEWACRLLAPLL